MNAKLPSVIALGLALYLAPSSSAQAGTDTLFILDGSNSMWGQVEGVAKIITAREVLGSVLRNLPAGANAGLMTYGHRREGDCQDVELLAPVGRPNPAMLSRQMGSIVPVGKTPIALALEMAAESFPDREGKKNVVLVSDGVATCERDPCQTAAALTARDINLTIHVIGFDVSNDEREQLQCIAEAGNGRYFHASDTEGFRQALAEFATVEPVRVAQPVQIPEPEPQRVVVAAPEPDGPEPLRVVIDKAHLMRIDTEASVVMVANPEIADVAVESSRMFFILGRQIGETNLFVLDAEGNEIIRSDVIVVPNPDRQITLHRNTTEATFSCGPRCEAIATPGGGGAGGGAGDAAGDAAAPAEGE